jgi:hypothetical protein
MARTTLYRPLVRFSAVLGLVLTAGAALEGTAHAITVRDTRGLAAAVERLRASGGTIVLRPNRYTALVVGARGPRGLRIVARPGARVGRILLHRTQAVRIVGLQVSPPGYHAWVRVLGSRRISFERVAIRGGVRLRSNVSVVDSSNVSFTRSSFMRCGEGTTPDAGYCLRLIRSRGISLTLSELKDCHGCDFIHGGWTTGLYVSGNTFDRAVIGRCGRHVSCHHQDLIHLHDGGRVLIDRNRFGVYQAPGAAQVYLTGNIRRVTITNNLFVGTDPALPGYESPTAIFVGNNCCPGVGLPRYVAIRNNTILTGAPRRLGAEGSVLLSPRYFEITRNQRPVVANNVLGLAKTQRRLCSRARTWVANVILEGPRCTRTDFSGPLILDPEGRPTAESRPLIDRAHPRYATPYDLDGEARDRRPDIGAYEYRRS